MAKPDRDPPMARPDLDVRIVTNLSGWHDEALVRALSSPGVIARIDGVDEVVIAGSPSVIVAFKNRAQLMEFVHGRNSWKAAGGMAPIVALAVRQAIMNAAG